MSYLYFAFFLLWFILTVFWQFESHRNNNKFIRKINTLNILPIWTFFAPRPGISDTHLLYRDKFENSTYSEWVEIPVFEERKLYHFLWNPLKRYNKLIVDAIAQLKSLKNLQQEKNIEEEVFQVNIKLSKGYLVILSIISRYPKLNEQSVSRQFIIAETSFVNDKRAFNPILSSPFHKI